MTTRKRLLPRIELEKLSTYRDAIYGFAILYILFFHANAINGVDFTFGNPKLRHFCTIMNNGNVGVDTFLFLSGIFLYYSFQKSNLQSFVKKRIVRLFTPLFIVDGAYWLIRYAILKGDILGFLTRITAIRFFLDGDQTIWFVSFILLCYIMYPCFYGFIYRDDNGRLIAARTLILMLIAYFSVFALMVVNKSNYDMLEIALTRFPVFIFGSGMGKFVYEKRTLPFSVIVPLIALAIFYSVLHFDYLHACYRRWAFLIGGVSMALIIPYACEFLNFVTGNKSFVVRIFSSVGKCSLELYLAQIMVNQVYRFTDFYVQGDFGRYCLFVVIPAIPIAFLASYIGKWIRVKQSN